MEAVRRPNSPKSIRAMTVLPALRSIRSASATNSMAAISPIVQRTTGPVRRGAGRRVDEIAKPHQYPGSMRRFWLSLLTAFALIAGGSAGASAFACPMEQAQAMATANAHDCCPQGQPSHQQAPQDHRMDGCLMAMACSGTPALQPASASIPIAHSIAIKHPLANSVDAPVGSLQELFRPPRSI